MARMRSLPFSMKLMSIARFVYGQNQGVKKIN